MNRGLSYIPRHARPEVEAHVRKIAPDFTDAQVERALWWVEVACDGDDCAPQGMWGLLFVAGHGVERVREADKKAEGSCASS
jgi:hypothetical protein